MKQIKKELTPMAAAGKPAVDLKFIPPFTLSYESTLDLKPLPTGKTKSAKSPAGRKMVKPRVTKKRGG
jgi:hypothetical protein